MAYRRCLSIRAALLARRSTPSFCYISHEDDRRKTEEYCPSASTADNYFAQRRSFASFVSRNPWRYSGAVSRSGSELFGSGLCMNRFMSTSTEEAADKIDYLSDVTAVITDAPIEAVTSQAAVLNELAAAAADSAFPVAALQSLIEGIHSFTGLNWWASIALATVLIRGVTLPFLINEAKSYKEHQCAEMLLLLLAEEVCQVPKGAVSSEKLRGLLGLSFVTLFKCLGTVLKGMAIRGPVFAGFFFAVTGMAHKVPSYKSGGAFWFTDLTAHDPTFVLPILTALSFLACFRSFWREKVTRPSYLAIHKHTALFFYWKCCFGGIAACCVLLVPPSIILPKALYCYMLTSNVFSFYINSCLNNPDVRKALRFPELPEPTPSIFSTDIGRKNWWSFFKR